MNTGRLLNIPEKNAPFDGSSFSNLSLTSDGKVVGVTKGLVGWRATLSDIVGTKPLQAPLRAYHSRRLCFGDVRFRSVIDNFLRVQPVTGPRRALASQPNPPTVSTIYFSWALAPDSSAVAICAPYQTGTRIRIL